MALGVADGVAEGVADGETKYVIHLFKDYVGAEGTCDLYWDGQSTLAPSASTVYLQIYNYDTPAWETIDSDDTTGPDIDFVLEGNIADLTDYKSPSEYITCRVYQVDI